MGFDINVLILFMFNKSDLYSNSKGHLFVVVVCWVLVNTIIKICIFVLYNGIDLVKNKVTQVTIFCILNI